MSNDVHYSGYLALVVCDFLFPGKGTGIPGHHGNSKCITRGAGQHHELGLPDLLPGRSWARCLHSERD